MKFLKLKSILAKISALLLLIALAWGCGRVPELKEVPYPSSRLPFVKVLLTDNQTRHTISSVGSGELAIDCYKKTKRYSYFSRRPVVVHAIGNKLELYSHQGNRIDHNIDRIIVSARGRKNILAFDAKNYRGLFSLSSSSGQIKLINTVYVEDYLKGVIPVEIGPTPEEQYEAIKAQAVACRTYAMSHVGQYGEDAGYDLKATIGDQAYEGIAVEDDLAGRAIKDTRGEVVVYGNGMIEAYYHSTCGGTTDDIEDVWDKDPRPYLISVSDDAACRNSKYFEWEERFSADQVILRLEQYLMQDRGKRVSLGRLLDIRITDHTPGGRVASITFETTSGHFSFEREKVRWVLKRSNSTDQILRSAKFDVQLERDDRGNIAQVIIKGRGYGHGVGMCQMGARGMAKAGITYDSILYHYYQGVAIKKIF